MSHITVNILFYAILLLDLHNAVTATQRVKKAAPSIMCPRNYEPQMVSGKPKTCSPDLEGDCQTGYFCNLYYNTNTKQEQNICCGKPLSPQSSGHCSNGDPMKDPSTGQIKNCKIGETGECPTGFTCVGEGTSSTTGHCCPNIEEIEPPPIGCPWGLEPLMSEKGTVIKCTPGKAEACPGKTICYYDAVETTNKCCGKSPSQGCPRGSRPQKGTSSTQIITCRPGVPSQTCAGDGVCQWSYLIDRYQCCESDNGCPLNMSPLVLPGGNVQACTIDQTTNCPANYQCEFNFGAATYQCCGQNLGYCPANQVPQMIPGTSVAKSCPGGVATYCSAGYVCTLSSTNQYVCCGAQGRCPATYQPALIESRAVTCSPGSTSSCPVGSTCQLATGGVVGQYLCCTQTGISTQYACTGGRVSEKYAGTAQVKTCSIGIAGQCSNGYRCEGSTTIGVAICCSINVQPTNILCPNGGSPDIIGNAPRYCSGLGVAGCRNGYSCQLSSNTAGTYVCCPSTTSVLCPGNTVPDTSSGNVAYCSPSNLNTCRSGYSCQLSSNIVGTYVCCYSGTSTNPLCPNNQQPDKNGVNPWYCSGIGAAGCRPGFTCQTSSNVPNSFVCCAASTGVQPLCPGSQQPDKSVGGVTVYCSGISASTCRGGYKCQLSINVAGRYVCCPATLAVKCPGNLNPDTNGGTYPWYCSGVGQPGCRSGYTCQQSTNFAGSFVCCPTTTNLLCPGSRQPQKSGVTPVFCSGVGSTNCLGGYSCQQSITSAGTYMCCPTQYTTPLCPNGQTPNTNPMYCTAVGATGCGFGASCQQASNMAGVFVCCSSQTSLLCPNSQPPAMQGSTPWYCSGINAVGCPASYSCQQSSTSTGIFLCCPAASSVTPTCPLGYSPNLVNDFPQPCVLNLAGSCVSPYQCTQASNRPGYYICCRFGATQNICPIATQTPLTYAGQVQYCSSSFAACPANGFTCQYSATALKYVCCGSSSTTSSPLVYQCASGRAVFAPNNHPYYCILGRNQCPSGYQCDLATDQIKRVCCLGTQVNPVVPSTAVLQCASGRRAYTASGVTKTCSIYSPSCPTSYSCELSTTQGQDVCCFTGTTTFRCPKGWTAYRIGSDPQTCTTSNPTICPSPYNCIESTQSNTYVCCKPGTDPFEQSTGPTCGNNGEPLANSDGVVKFCTLSAYKSCPDQYRCVRNTQAQKDSFICCTTPPSESQPVKACPNPLTQEMQNGLGKTCQSNSDCSVNYYCVLSLLNNNQVCCGGRNEIEQGRGQVVCEGNAQVLIRDNAPIKCITGPNACPQGYSCRKPLSGGNDMVCCENLSCPVGLALAVGNQNSPLFCTDNPGACPSGSTCTPTASHADTKVCCKAASTEGLSCIGRQTLMGDDQKPVFCQLPDNCPGGYECSGQSTTKQYICCATTTTSNTGTGSTDVCPRGEEPYVDPITYDYFYCSDVGYACPTGYICKNQVNKPDAYICCKAKAMCQRGWLPYVPPGGIKPKTCNIDDPTSCNPPGRPYKCQLSSLPGEYLCCMESLIQWEIDEEEKKKMLASTPIPTGAVSTITHRLTIEDFLEDLADG